MGHDERSIEDTGLGEVLAATPAQVSPGKSNTSWSELLLIFCLQKSISTTVVFSEH